MNQDLVAKIREEASAITGKDRAGRVTYENNKEFKWAHAVIREALRLHPSIPKVRPCHIRSSCQIKNRVLIPEKRAFFVLFHSAEGIERQVCTQRRPDSRRPGDRGW